MSFVNKEIRGTFENRLATYQLKSKQIILLSHYDNKMTQMRILFHSMTTKWVSDAKLCNNVANYGTKQVVLPNLIEK